MSQHQSPLQQQLFDDIDNLMNIQSRSQYQSQIKSLKETITQYQQICKRLSQNNTQLQQRLQQYQIQIQQYQQKTLSQKSISTIFNQEYSTIHLDCNNLQEMIKEYKNQLLKYKNKISQSQHNKNQLIYNLKQQNKQYKLLIEQLKTKVKQIQQHNIQLQGINHQLMIQMEDIQQEMKRRTYKIQTPKYKYQRQRQSYKSYQHYQTSTNYQDKSFNDNIQDQYQKMIQKLIKELEYQKNIKKKVNQEIKRFQKDIVELEKEIMNKNQRIYSLEIDALKKIKNQNMGGYGKNQGQEKGNIKAETRNTQNARVSQRQRIESRIYQSKRNFSLMQLTNGQITLNCKEKLSLALKLIQFYQKKLKDQDYTFLILGSVSVSNFSSTNLNRMTIKPIKLEGDQQIQQEYQKSQLQIIWNLGFLLDTIFNKSADIDQQFGTYAQQTYLNQFVTQILQNRDMNNYDTVLQLQKVVKSALKHRT